MVFIVKNNCSGLKIFPAIGVGPIFKETGVLTSSEGIVSCKKIRMQFLIFEISSEGKINY